MEKLPSKERGNEEEPFWICKDCHGDKVHPVAQNEVGTSHRHLSLRCAECERRTEVIVSQALADQYDSELDRSTHAIANDLALLAHACFADDMDRFLKALKRDAILPEDF